MVSGGSKVEMEIGSVEITFFHVGIGIGMFLVYLILSTVWKQIKLRRERKTPNILASFEKVPGLHAVRHPNYTLFRGAHASSPHSTVYAQDRQRVQRLLRNLLQSPSIHVPEDTVAVCIPTWCSTTGDRFHQFHCRPPAPFCPCPTIVSEYHYTYKMVSARVQATFYHDRRCTCLAGLCIYLRIADEPWWFVGGGDLPETLIMRLIGRGVKRWSPRGTHRRRGGQRRLPRVTVPPTAATTTPSTCVVEVETRRHLWYVLSVEEEVEHDSEDQRHLTPEEEEEEEDVEDVQDCEIGEGEPPAYSTVLSLRRESHVDDLPPPSYFSLFSRSTKL